MMTKRRLLRWAFFALLLVFCFCAARMIGHFWQLKSEQDEFERLAEIVQAAPQEDAMEQTMLPGMAALYAQNPDVFGWLKIEGTAINYPVMFTPDRVQFYLKRDFQGRYSESGSLFVDEACFEGCGNYLIHGHNMHRAMEETMFMSLAKYKKEDYWMEHPTVSFSTLWEEREYEVVAAFYGKIYDTEDPGFRYYEYTDLTERAAFEEYVGQVAAAALYDTGVDAEYGDELITLSTCNSYEENGRFVVVARRCD